MRELILYKEPVFGNWRVMWKGTPHKNLEVSVGVWQRKRDKREFSFWRKWNCKYCAGNNKCTVNCTTICWRWAPPNFLRMWDYFCQASCISVITELWCIWSYFLWLSCSQNISENQPAVVSAVTLVVNMYSQNYSMFLRCAPTLCCRTVRASTVFSPLLIKCRIAEHFASPLQNSLCATWHMQHVTQRGWWASTQTRESESLLQEKCLSPCFSLGWVDCPQNFCMVTFGFENQLVGCLWTNCFVIWDASTTGGEHLSLCLLRRNTSHWSIHLHGTKSMQAIYQSYKSNHFFKSRTKSDITRVGTCECVCI